MNSNKLHELQKQQQSKNGPNSKPRGLLSFEQFIQYLKDEAKKPLKENHV